jgi:hypothetical protein
MKRFFLVCLIFAIGLAAGCGDDSKANNSSEPLLRLHFSGMNRVLDQPGLLNLKEVWALPTTQQLRKQALDKIAIAPFQLCQNALPPGAVDQPALIRPLLDDLIVGESYIELNGSDQGYDSIIAIETGRERASRWSTNLWHLLSAWKFSKPDSVSPNAWRAHAKNITFEFQQRGNWVLAGWSFGKPRSKSLLSILPSAVRPVASLTNRIVDVHADLPALGRWSSILAGRKLPRVEFTVSPRGEYVHTEGRLLFSEALSWKFEAWQIPTNLISDPLVGFTVAQGIQPLMKELPGFSELQLKAPPSQLCGWSWGSVGFRTYWSFPMNNASNQLRHIAERAPAFLRHYFQGEPLGSMLYVTNRSELYWTELPLITPLVKSATDQKQDYVIVALAPMRKPTMPPPHELFSQLKGRTNLLYYDWEITQDRLLEWRRIYQRIDMVYLRKMAPTNAPSLNWFDEAAPRLGNTITELELRSPKELKLSRKSHIGFTGYELATFLRWIDSRAFPLGYEPPPSGFAKSPRPKGSQK